MRSTYPDIVEALSDRDIGTFFIMLALIIYFPIYKIRAYIKKKRRKKMGHDERQSELLKRERQFRLIENRHRELIGTIRLALVNQIRSYLSRNPNASEAETFNHVGNFLITSDSDHEELADGDTLYINSNCCTGLDIILEEFTQIGYISKAENTASDDKKYRVYSAFKTFLINPAKPVD